MELNKGNKTIFIAEGENHVRNALHLMLDDQERLVLIGEASTPESLIAQVCRKPPDIILLDLGLPGIHPQHLIPVLEKCCPESKLVITSVRPEAEKIAKELGCDTFLLKQLPPDEYIEALLTVVGT
jgi:DNA-binding NarL/FixJ family response regulator